MHFGAFIRYSPAGLRASTEHTSYGDWHHLGLKLGVPEDELRAIRLNNPVDLNACKREMLSRWLQRDIQAMYTKLEDALLECGDSETASDVAKQRGSGCQWKD